MSWGCRLVESGYEKARARQLKWFRGRCACVGRPMEPAHCRIHFRKNSLWAVTDFLAAHAIEMGENRNKVAISVFVFKPRSVINRKSLRNIHIFFNKTNYGLKAEAVEQAAEGCWIDVQSVYSSTDQISLVGETFTAPMEQQRA